MEFALHSGPDGATLIPGDSLLFCLETSMGNQEGFEADWIAKRRKKRGVTGLSQACRIGVGPLFSTKRPTPGVGVRKIW
jgi:hypothetical protein